MASEARVQAREIRKGDLLVTGRVRRCVADVMVSQAVYLACSDGSSPVFPLDRTVLVVRASSDTEEAER